jgi:hypothetical protein
MHEIDQEVQLSQDRNPALPPHTPAMLTIDGPLSEGRVLSHPLAVLVEYDDGEFLVSEPYFSIHGSGSTIAEAIAAFRRIFSGYLDVLTSREETLGPQLREQLHYLRSAIRVA